MARIVDRQAFNSAFKNKQIDVDRLKGDQQLQQAAAAGGGSVDDLARADLDRDGKIAGGDEMKELFKQVDNFDHNRDANSFIVKDDTGAAVPAGKVLDRLAFLAENRQTGSAATAAPGVDNSARAQAGRRLAQEGRSGLLERTARHNQLVEERGVGTHYGDHSWYSSMSYQDKRKQLQEWTKAGQTPVDPNQLKQTSCVGWALENVVAAYDKAGRGERGREIQRIVQSAYTDPSGKVHRDLKGMGGILCRELQKDGWQAIYFAHDSKNPDEPGSTARQQHQGYTNMAKGQKKFWAVYPYEKLRVDDYVMDYRPSSDSNRQPDLSGIEKLKNVPFAVGVAKGGTHCFAMHDGVVSENHWTAGPNDAGSSIFEETPLQDWGWSTGLIMVPPGTWK
ncbi:MAG: hypothetical protein JXR83_19745 [Deltaproteobacteria bacterium]|nr:hypothetical protein [Deltaproteobacteria bacterium]